MYHLDYSIPRRYQTQEVQPAEIRRVSHRMEERGFFTHQGRFEVPPGDQGHESLVCHFNPVIYIAVGLDRDERQEVLNHEIQHYNDFIDEVNPFHRYLRRAVRTASWDELWSAWQWFLYNLCDASARFHRSLQRTSIEFCRRPSGQCPY